MVSSHVEYFCHLAAMGIQMMRLSSNFASMVRTLVRSQAGIEGTRDIRYITYAI